MHYLLISSVSVCIFYGVYKLFMAGDTYWQYKRIYLVLSILFSLLLPLLEWESTAAVSRSEQAPIISYQALIEAPTVSVWASSAQFTSFKISLLEVLRWFYITVITLLFFRFLWRLRGIYKLYRLSPKQWQNGYCVVSLNEEQRAFSFFHWIFISDTYSSNEKQCILQHEYAHTRQWHSLDSILVEILCMIQFFNPFAYLMAKEIRLNHEYIADRYALTFTEKKSYFSILLEQSLVKTEPLTHSFYYSPIKKRIMMQVKNPGKYFCQVKILAFIPLALGLLFYFGCKAPNQEILPSKEGGLVTQDTIKRMPEFEITYLKPKKGDSMVSFIADVMFSPLDVEKEELRKRLGDELPGVMLKYTRFIQENLVYPQKAVEKKIEGDVYQKLRLNIKTGNIVSIDIIKTVKEDKENLLSQELIRVNKLLPEGFFAPYSMDSSITPLLEGDTLSFIMPVNFRL